MTNGLIIEIFIGNKLDFVERRNNYVLILVLNVLTEVVGQRTPLERNMLKHCKRANNKGS